MNTFRCLVCGYIFVGDAPPETCPICDAPASQFELVDQKKVMPKTNSFRCLNCEYTVEGEQPPSICPVCGMEADHFEAIDHKEPDKINSSIKKVVVLGSGIAALAAVETLREMDEGLEITMVTNETKLPYYRLNLTRYLGEEIAEGSLCIHPQYWYDEQRIQIFKNRVITEIRPNQQLVVTADGLEFSYDKLIIALGAHPFIPPIKGINQPGITCIRDVDEVKALRSKIVKGDRVVVIGGGVLGLETAGALSAIGGAVTVAEGASWLMPRQLNETGSGYVGESLKSIGVSVVYEFRTSEIVKNASGFEILSQDGRVLNAKHIIVATGVRPNTYLARVAELEVHKGIVVNDCMKTSEDLIYAAGDITEHYGVTYGLWNIAQFQGRIAAMNLLGLRTPFGGVPRSNALKVLDVELFSIGEISGEDASYSVFEKVEKDSYIRFLIHDQLVVGGIAIGYGDSSYKLKKLVESKQHLLPEQLISVESLIEALE